MHREVARVAYLVEALKHGVKIDSARLPQSEVSACSAAGAPLPRAATRWPNSPPSGGDHAIFDARLLNAGSAANRLTGVYRRPPVQNLLVLRIDVEDPRGDALDHVRTVAL